MKSLLCHFLIFLLLSGCSWRFCNQGRVSAAYKSRSKLGVLQIDSKYNLSENILNLPLRQCHTIERPTDVSLFGLPVYVSCASDNVFLDSTRLLQFIQVINDASGLQNRENHIFFFFEGNMNRFSNLVHSALGDGGSLKVRIYNRTTQSINAASEEFRALLNHSSGSTNFLNERLFNKLKLISSNGPDLELLQDINRLLSSSALEEQVSTVEASLDDVSAIVSQFRSKMTFLRVEAEKIFRKHQAVDSGIIRKHAREMIVDWVEVQARHAKQSVVEEAKDDATDAFLASLARIPVNPHMPANISRCIREAVWNFVATADAAVSSVHQLAAATKFGLGKGGSSQLLTTTPTAASSRGNRTSFAWLRKALKPFGLLLPRSQHSIVTDAAMQLSKELQSEKRSIVDTQFLAGAYNPYLRTLTYLPPTRISIHSMFHPARLVEAMDLNPAYDKHQAGICTNRADPIPLEGVATNIPFKPIGY